MIERVYACTLSWAELDPARHPFDPGTAGEVVRSLEPAARMPPRERERPDSREWSWRGNVAGPWLREMTAALVERYGRWASGWDWAASEPGGGGPVHGWCCENHSMTDDPDETLGLIAECLVEWRAWLEDLAERFARFPIRDVPPEDRELMWERAAVHLVTQVMDRTGAEDSWYGTAQTVLRWYLTDAGVAEADAERLVEEAVGGRFRSWIAAEPRVITEVGERLAASLVRLEGDDA